MSSTDITAYNDFEAEARLEAADICIRPATPGADPCSRGYDHTGHCDWFAAAYAAVMANGMAPELSDPMDPRMMPDLHRRPAMTVDYLDALGDPYALPARNHTEATS